MGNNSKQSSNELGSLAASILHDPNASGIQKKLAGSVLSQTHTPKQTSAEMERIASQALKNGNSAENTKILAGSVLSQSVKERK